MPGELIFYATMLIGFGLFATLSFLKLRGQQYFYNDMLGAGFRIGMEHSLAAIFFSLLPFAMFYLLSIRVVLWDIASLILSVFIALELIRIVMTGYQIKTNWNPITIVLIVASIIILTTVLANAVWWNTLELYILGVLWTVGIALVQLFTLVYFDPDPIPKANTIRYYHHADLLKRLWRNRSTDRANRASDNNTNANTNAVSHSERRRYGDGFAFTAPRQPNGRTFSHPAIRRNPDS